MTKTARRYRPPIRHLPTTWEL